MAGTSSIERNGLKRTLTRIGALAEVLLAFALVHVAFRAIKHFTRLGQLEGAARLNFTPGAVMILFTVCVLLLLRRSFTDYGLTFAGRGEDVKTGLLWGCFL